MLNDAPEFPAVYRVDDSEQWREFLEVAPGDRSDYIVYMATAWGGGGVLNHSSMFIVSGRRVTRWIDPYSGQRMTTSRDDPMWELEPVFGGDAKAYVRDISANLVRVEAEELARLIAGDCQGMRQKARLQIEAMLAGKN